MIVLFLSAVLAARQFDTCRAQFSAWAEQNKNSYSKTELSQFYDYALRNKCNLQFDSLPQLVSLRNAIDSIKAAEWKKSDTVIDWNSWISLNRTNYSDTEINHIHSRWRSGAKSHEFYSLIETLQEQKKRDAEVRKRKSFAHLAVSIANSDSLKLIYITHFCQMRAGDTIATQWSECKERKSFLGIFYDSIHTIKKRQEIRKVSSLYFKYLISEDSATIHEKRQVKNANITSIGIASGWNYVAALVIFYDDTKYIIEFDEENQNMEHYSGDVFVREYYTKPFYTQLLGIFKKNVKRTTK